MLGLSKSANSTRYPASSRASPSDADPAAVIEHPRAGREVGGELAQVGSFVPDIANAVRL